MSVGEVVVADVTLVDTDVVLFCVVVMFLAPLVISVRECLALLPQSPSSFPFDGKLSFRRRGRH